ncbi:RNA-binding protein [Geminocystis sp. NIES-3709]|uniref:RNA recognition motif domain-containing protein n=1 Tax=Geminocystis sp. NIES-3709 TaxID=1617448 RepID=UPI0005FCB2F4|nr:RNA-binding protein [Geminocystis sp. NIES-3709]BAQ65907.1 RNA-binding protein [Geminocystis sp. NIES-3709]
MSVRLYVKLPKAELEKEGFEKMFSEFEPSFTTKLIKERKKNECRGFGFVTVPTDEDADLFISKYNEQVFVYNGEPFKDENGADFILLIEKALPRTKGDKEDNGATAEVEASEVQSDTENDNVALTTPTEVNTVKPSRREGPKKTNGKKGRKGGGGKQKGDKPVSVSESIQPDPRWANELSKLKEMFAAQTPN